MIRKWFCIWRIERKVFMLISQFSEEKTTRHIVNFFLWQIACDEEKKNGKLIFLSRTKKKIMRIFTCHSLPSFSHSSDFSKLLFNASETWILLHFFDVYKNVTHMIDGSSDVLTSISICFHQSLLVLLWKDSFMKGSGK